MRGRSKAKELRMTNFTETLNFSLTGQENRAVEIDKRKDINIYETLCLYCAENSIDANNITDEDFYAAVETIENFGSNDKSFDKFFFWIDQSALTQRAKGA